MIKLSLVQTSRDRAVEVVRFIDSLNGQINIDFAELQLIFVDQGNLKHCFDTLNPNVDFVYLRTSICSLSKARNVALGYVKGKYIAFPDDDCWYVPETLSKVFDLCASGLDGVVGYGCNEINQPTNVFAQNSRYIGLYDHCGAISYTIFLKFNPIIRFDENLGVGSPHKLSSGEETDYLIQFMNSGLTNVFFSRDVIVHHPSARFDYFANETKKMYYYARGFGYLMKKHHYPLRIILKSIVRPIGGLVLFSCQLNFKKAARSWNILKGRIEGYFCNLEVE